MMYQNGLVAVVKVNGRVLREDSGTVYIPFGSEYSLLLKNLKSKRVMVNVAIDGTDIADGTQFIINANSSIELERFVRNGNLSSGNKFKFIERTSEVEDHRGVQAEDGLVRIEYWTEKVATVTPSIVITNEWKPQSNPYWNGTYTSSINTDSMTKSLEDRPRNVRSFTGGACGQSLGGETYSGTVNYCSSGIPICASTGAPVEAKNDAGITVCGAQSNQRFSTVMSFPVEFQSEVIVLNLKGKTQNVKVKNAFTVKTTKVCETCGKKSPGTVSFCPRCGTSLNII